MEKKKGTYLKYAIGEIVLVVIGILIALSINNWNEQKKNEQTIIIALKEVQHNLLLDIEASQENVNDFMKLNTLLKKIFDSKNPWTSDDYKNKKVSRYN
ncbi:DUF6090 family protein [Psychroserpens burtonensis]|uniref:DUF6090 family protein n=1 Tax=Psychroserpens burtonensis TaxID=49278 RepID=UPI0004186CF2|nr:DUF6090 family protein [Psychroserpens burtonensis]